MRTSQQRGQLIRRAPHPELLPNSTAVTEPERPDLVGREVVGPTEAVNHVPFIAQQRPAPHGARSIREKRWIPERRLTAR